MSDPDLERKVDDLQLQLYIGLSVGFIAIFLLLILDIILFGIVERLRAEQKSYANEKKFRFNPSPEIHPREEVSRRGFKKYPSFSSDLVARVESRESTSRGHATT